MDDRELARLAPASGDRRDRDAPPPWPRSLPVAEACARLLFDHRLGRLLDAGGGAGILTGYLMRRRVIDSATVLDPRASVLAEVPPSIVTRQGLLEELDDADGEYSTILLRQVLHYVPSPETALRRLRDRLRPDGALYVGQIVAPDLDCARWLGHGANWVSSTRHRVWTADQLLDVFARAELRVRRVAMVAHWQALDDGAHQHRGSLSDHIRRTIQVEDRRGTVCCRLSWVHALLIPEPARVHLDRS
jgi:SAM-dependent methyltransferase